MRSLICSILANVNCGKTTLADKFRHTNVHQHEAGGITQRMMVTHFSNEKIVELTKEINKPIEINGIMLIDTPGHECFTNQRMCGVTASDIVIILVDIFKGIEKATVDCIELLRKTKTPFIVAANKIDKIYGWKDTGNSIATLKSGLAGQSKKTKQELEDLLTKVEVSFAENGLNAKRYYQNTNMKEFISIVPISAKSGVGLSDLLILINILASKFLRKKLAIDPNITSGILLETVKDTKLGEYSSSIVLNGTLRSIDKIVFINDRDEIETGEIRHLMTDQGITVGSIDHSNDCRIKLKEHHNIRPGSSFYAYDSHEDIQMFRDLLQKEIDDNKLEISVEYTTPGVYLNAPTMGMGIALYNLCKSKEIPITEINIGEIKKVQVMKVGNSVSNSKDIDEQLYNRRFKTVLAYDVAVSKDSQELAKETGVTILTGNIIYHLVDEYMKLVDGLDKSIRERHSNLLPKSILTIIDRFVFVKRNPIIMGVTVRSNDLHKGMSLSTKNLKGEHIVLGKVDSIQKDKKDVELGKVGEDVCIKINPINDIKYEYGKDFNSSSDLETYYSKTDSELLEKYKKIFNP
jgi:small GTP-binding protein